jgi:hypothetical protein
VYGIAGNEYPKILVELERLQVFDISIQLPFPDGNCTVLPKYG